MLGHLGGLQDAVSVSVNCWLHAIGLKEPSSGLMSNVQNMPLLWVGADSALGSPADSTT